MGEANTLERSGIDFAQFPQVALCHRPTPIEDMPRLTKLLGGPKLFIKRDDCTGLALGGNKTRKLEFLVGEALAQGADMLVTQGAVQSNHVRQTAAAACKFGLQCHVLAGAARARGAMQAMKRQAMSCWTTSLAPRTNSDPPVSI